MSMLLTLMLSLKTLKIPPVFKGRLFSYILNDGKSLLWWVRWFLILEKNKGTSLVPYGNIGMKSGQHQCGSK